jgi:hypothetical protein
MKTKTLLPILFVAIAFIACTNNQLKVIEDDFTTNIQKNWNNKELDITFYNNQSILSHYHINADKLRSIVQNESVIKLRFILGLNQNQELEIEIAGIDNYGKITSSFTSTKNTNTIFKTSIDNLNYSTYKYINESNSSTHLLPYKTAYRYINKWEKAIQQKQIETLISYEGKRIRYFSLPKQIVNDMTASSNVNAIALFLGVNDKEKLTTVFIQKTHDGNLLLKEEHHFLGSTTNENDDDNNEGNIYDFTKPCPNLCD